MLFRSADVVGRSGNAEAQEALKKGGQDIAGGHAAVLKIKRSDGGAVPAQFVLNVSHLEARRVGGDQDQSMGARRRGIGGLVLQLTV